MSERPGLRERKRTAAMRRVQTVALDLFDEHGFDAVTIERIAEVSEVSPSSIYRYFGTKEMLVIWDEYDPAALAAMGEALEDHTPMEAVRLMVRTLVVRAFEDDRDRVVRRMRLADGHPSLEAASAVHAWQMGGLIADVIARSSGRDAEDLEVQVFANAFVGGLFGAIRHWSATGFGGDFSQVVERAMDVLEHGLDLDPARP